MRIEDLVKGKSYFFNRGDVGYEVLVFEGMLTSGMFKGQAEFDISILGAKQVASYISETNPPSFDDDYTKALKQGQLIMITELQSTLLSMATHSQDMTEEGAALRTMECVKGILIASRERLEGEL